MFAKPRHAGRASSMPKLSDEHGVGQAPDRASGAGDQSVSANAAVAGDEVNARAQRGLRRAPARALAASARAGLAQPHDVV
jgi:hypothetical protein